MADGTLSSVVLLVLLLNSSPCRCPLFAPVLIAGDTAVIRSHSLSLSDGSGVEITGHDFLATWLQVC